MAEKLCLLVGGSKGLGRALLQTYREKGYSVIEFSRTGNSESHRTVDLSRRETAIDTIDNAFAEATKDRWDEIQLIINAAILSPIGPLSMSEPKEWWQHIDINFTLPISILGRFQTHMKEMPCRKVAAFVSSGAAEHAFDGWGLYGASKAGVNQFIRSMALEQARLASPIWCAILNPGVMDTEMQASIRNARPDQFSQLNSFVQRYEAGELALPEVVAHNIYTALSQPFSNGAEIRVAG